jgi:hypothetical protein
MSMQDAEVNANLLLRMGKLYAELPANVELAACEVYIAEDDSIACLLPGWVADDGNQEIEYPTADTAAEAAAEYVADGDWGDGGGFAEIMTWRTCYSVDGAGDVAKHRIYEETHTLQCPSGENVEPDCADGHEHEWRSPYSVVGGLKENPGVWGNGGGVKCTEVCAHCGTYRETDTWAQNPSSGEVIPFPVLTYRGADSESMEWVESLQSNDAE